MAKKRKQVVHFLNTYRFLPQEKDPIIDQVHTLFQDIGASVREIHEIGLMARRAVRSMRRLPPCWRLWAMSSSCPLTGALSVTA
jgi:hypothetical protein